MAGRLYKPKAKSFWTLVRRLLLRRNQKPPAHPAAEEEKSELLSGRRSSLEELLLTDGAPEDAATGCRCALGCAKKHGQATVAEKALLLPAGLHRPVMAQPETASDGVAAHRRFMFGGFRRRLLMRRPWRPMLVAIPE